MSIETKKRNQYGFISGLIGIISNIILFGLKITIGIFSGSIAIIANAIDSLSDATSSIITLISFKISNKKPDKEHPFGHQRIEYIAGLILSFLILLIGINLFYNSITNIMNKPILDLSLFVIIILIISVFIKVVQFFFYYIMNKKINSVVLKGASRDALNDIFTTLAVLLSSIILFYNPSITINLDAILAAIISILIIISGIGIFKEASSPLIGTIPDIKIIEELKCYLLKNKLIIGYHDMMMHSYGPNKIYCSVHLEFDYRNDILEVHELIDTLEKDILDHLNIEIVIHMDPVVTDDDETNVLKDQVYQIIKAINPDVDMHDFRLVKGKRITKVLFDCEVNGDLIIDEETFINDVKKQISLINSKYHCLIGFDRNFF